MYVFYGFHFSIAWLTAKIKSKPTTLENCSEPH